LVPLENGRTRGARVLPTGDREGWLASSASKNDKYLLILRQLLRVRRIVFYLKALSTIQEPIAMSDHHGPKRHPASESAQSWAVAIATALLVLLIAGVLPRIL
jgi:hypothetical protein